MAIWELQASGSIAKSPVRLKTLPTNNTSYGDEYVYDLTPPDIRMTLSCAGLAAAELTKLQTAIKTRNGVVSVIDSTGTTRTGRLESLSWEVIQGTNLYNASITIADLSYEASTNLTVNCPTP